MNEKKLKTGVYFDFETTGFSATDNEVIEIGIVEFLYDPFSMKIISSLNCYNMLQQPSSPLSFEIKKLTGLSDEMLDGQSIDWGVVERVMSKAEVIIAHNVEFDKKFLLKHLSSLSEKVYLDSCHGIDWKEKGCSSKKLLHLCADHGISIVHAHRALFDALAGFQLIEYHFDELVNAASREYFHLMAIKAPFETKDTLKERGYFWQHPKDPQEKGCWTIRLEKSKLEAEIIFLDNEIYKGLSKTHQTVKI